jgi:heptosyltransferase-2
MPFSYIHLVKSFQPQKILVVRTDRIGDVVLSLPIISILKSAFPSSTISFLLRSYTRELAAEQKGLDRILLYDVDHVEKPFVRMLSELRREKFDAVVVTYPTARLAFLMYLAAIPLRVGTGYRWYSVLFNRKIYEHRKTAEKHESEYNLSLLRGLGVTQFVASSPKLVIPDEARMEAREALRTLKLGADAPLILLHPGSGGSARDWKPERFGALAEKLTLRGNNVIVTGGPGEESLVQQVVQAAQGRALALPSPLSLKALAALIETANVFVANSTGPLHIAAAVGTPVVGFYPPILQCSSKRWGPLTEKKVIFEPSAADCPLCNGGECRGDECMDLISVEEVEKAVEHLLMTQDRKQKMYENA